MKYGGKFYQVRLKGKHPGQLSGALLLIDMANQPMRRATSSATSIRWDFSGGRCNS